MTDDCAASLVHGIALIKQAIPHPETGLPEEAFLFVTTITPMINVDLLIRDDAGRVLLTWRNEQYTGIGWHVPGGIIRYRETAADRIAAVARNELSTEVECSAAPLAITESILAERRERGHFVSLLYDCRLKQPLDPRQQHESGNPAPGQWRWFAACPDDILPCHAIYRPHFREAGS